VCGRDRFNGHARIVEIGEHKALDLIEPAAAIGRRSGEPSDDAMSASGFMLYLVCCGEVGVDQDGRTARIGAGDLFIYDQSQPFTLEFGGDSIVRQVVDFDVALEESPTASAPRRSTFSQPHSRSRLRARWMRVPHMALVTRIAADFARSARYLDSTIRKG
jgi:hypothetical protein